MESKASLKDSLLGLTALNQDLVLLNYGNVVIRRDYKSLNTLKLLSGGTASADIFYATLVGKGMLTAAVLGDGSAPSSRLILHTIKELNQGEYNCGIFVIGQANSELFNFGLAVERANIDCRSRVSLLTIDEDRSQGEVVRERNSCGIVLLIKIIGAVVEKGALYDDVRKLYEEVTNFIITVPFNYITDDSGKQPRDVRLSQGFDGGLQAIAKTSKSSLESNPSIPMVVLVNVPTNLEKITRYSLVKQVIEHLNQLGVSIIRMYMGNFILNSKKPASITMLKVYNNKIIEYLDAPCGAPGWQQVQQFLPEITLNNEIPGVLTQQGKQQIPLKGPRLDEKQTNILITSVQFACDALISCEKQLNIIDAERSVGNVGTRLKTFADCVNNRIQNKTMVLDCPFNFFKKLGVLAEGTMGGTMGSIYGIFFENTAGFFEILPENSPITPVTWAKALTKGTEGVRKYCIDEMETKTMYFPIKQCENVVNRELNSRGDNFIESYGLGISTAEESAQKTRLPECKFADAGAHAVGIWMRALYEGVKLMSLCNSNKDVN